MNLAQKIGFEVSHQAGLTSIEHVPLSGGQWDALAAAAKGLPDINWQRNALTLAQVDYCSAIYAAHDSVLKDIFPPLQRGMKKDGVCLISLGERATEDQEALKSTLAVLVSAICRPFGAFLAKGFWQTLRVNPQARNLRADSIGTIPFHCDLDQAARPPDYVVLCCVRADPFGGGENRIVNYKNLLGSLSSQVFADLAETTFSYSTLFGTYNLGGVQNPHRLIDVNFKGSGDWACRYNGKARPQFLEDSSEARLFDALEEAFANASVEVALTPGDLIILDQRQVLHARNPLARRPLWPCVSPDKDRLFLQLYGNDKV